jgi:hypothetical protein
MSFIKSFLVYSLAGLAFLMSGCSEKIETGSLLRDFIGVEGVDTLSPNSVRVYWSLHSRFREFKVYYNKSSEPLATTSFNELVVRDLSPDTSYTFKVVGVDGDQTVGANKEITVKTFKIFQGPSSLIKDAEGTIILNWDYPEKVGEFQIFYKKYEDPTAANTSNWEAIDRVSIDQKASFGNLSGSTRYHFAVHVKYRDGTFARSSKILSIFTNASFPPPYVELSPISIGSLPFAKINPVVTSEYLAENYTSRIYMGDTPVSDPLTGQGTIVFSSAVNWPLGKIENLSVKVNYKDANKNETMIFDNLNTYIKGIPGTKEMPPVSSLGAGVAFLGEAMTSGDFNCDGSPDLAIGMPNISISSLGVKSSRAGAVYVYYSYKPLGASSYRLKTSPDPSRNPLVPGIDPQIITFEDLSDRANFGKSLAGNGNLNGDTNLGKQCQDLLVGAPGLDTPASGNGYDGAAFVFFGSAAGLKAPTKIKDMQQNVESCNGLAENASCSAVMLWPDTRLWPGSYWDESKRFGGYSGTEFGFSVAFIGDYNADGYDDIGIGVPRGDWDGVVNPLLPGDSKYEFATGYVALYFGAKAGIGYETPFASGIPSTSDIKFRFLKIYSPVPHSGARFGHSISGGVDVDGGFRVRSPSDSNPLVGGADFVVGAPGDRYVNATNSANKTKIKGPLGGSCGNANSCAALLPAEDGWGNVGNVYPDNAAAQYYSLPVDTGTGPGAAYLYFGRAAESSAESEFIEKPYRNLFWGCGNRAMPDKTHFSCLTSNSNFRVLFPRSFYKTENGSSLASRGFGTSVALLGNKSYYGIANDISNLTTPRDSNGDGFGDVVVSSSSFSISNKSNSGALWLFYGNNYKHFEQGPFKTANRDNDWNDNNPRCTSFNANDATTKSKCAPTLLRSNSIGSNFYLGLYPEAIAVGDINGDGLDDVTLGATGDNTLATNSGAVYSFLSLRNAGLTSNFLQFYNYQSVANDYFGRSVAVGNFDDDYVGIVPSNDIFVGAFLDKSDRAGGGAAYGYLSKGQPLSSVNSVPDLKIVDRSASPQNMRYDSIRIVGDINRDGYDDAVAQISTASTNTTEYTTSAILFFGSPIGLVTTSFCKENLTRVLKSTNQDASYCMPSVNPIQGITLNSTQLPQLITRPTNLSLGWAKRAFAVGDVNGDGFADVAFHDFESDGQIVIYYGSRAGLQSVSNPKWLPAEGDPQIVTKRWSSMRADGYSRTLDDFWPHRRVSINFGYLNDDDYADIIVSNPTASSFFTMNVPGGLQILPQYLPSAGTNPGANGGWQCYEQSDGSCKAGTQAQGMGRVWIYYGSAKGLQTPKMLGYSLVDNEPDVSTSLASTSPNHMIDTYDTESPLNPKACPNTAADKSCKMQYLYSPLIKNVNYGYASQEHFFGASVAVMDADNDGFDDLVISAPGYEDASCYYGSSGILNYGRLFVYYGSFYGVRAAPRESFVSAVTPNPGSCGDGTVFHSSDVSLHNDTRLFAISPPLYDANLGSNGSARYFGYRISPAGDVNKDGYEDLLVSAPMQTPVAGLSKSGVSYIYYGPLCSSDNHTDMWLYLGNNLNTQILYTDTNNPANPAFPKCMRNSGTPKPAPQVFSAWDARPYDYAGSEVASGRKGKADFNGDGYDDVVIGAFGSDDLINQNNDLGRGIVFFGSKDGLHTADYPDTVVVSDSKGKTKPFIIQKIDSELSPRYFFGNTSSGDVNNDGTMDIIVPSEYHDGHVPLNGIDIGTFYMIY